MAFSFAADAANMAVGNFLASAFAAVVVAVFASSSDFSTSIAVNDVKPIDQLVYTRLTRYILHINEQF